MSNKEQKYSVVLVNISSTDEKAVVETNAYDCEADGIEEFSLDEKTVDEVLGQDSFTASGADSKAFKEIEEFVKGRKGNFLKVYFCKNNYSDRSKVFFEKITSREGLEAELLVLDWEDWNAEWRKYFNKIEVSDELRIVPEWQQENLNPENDIIIYPGMGFGTGDHQTTYLCLKIFEDIRRRTDIKSVLDFGCGSGILGIAALKKLRGIYCEFCDIDTRALDNCVQNLTLNFDESILNGQRIVSRKNFTVEREFDLVFANILEPVLLQEKDVIDRSVKIGGDLIVSGILREQCESIRSEYTNFEESNVVFKDDWACIHFIKK